MSSSDSDTTFVDEDEDEEGKIYHWIYQIHQIDEDDKEEKEEVEIPFSSEHKPVHTTEDERMTNDTGTPRSTLDTTGAQRQREQKVGHTKGQYKDVANYIQVRREPKVKAEKKLWRRAGADISDYFNFGFDEESWNNYCKKQTQLHGAARKLNNKIKDQKGHTTHEEKHSGRGSSSHTSSIRASRQSRCTTDVIGGKPGHRRREKQGWITDKGDNTQRVNRISPEEQTMNSYNLSSSSSISSGHDFILPQRVLSRPRPPPLCQPVTDSVLSKRLDVPSASPNQGSSGVTSLILKNTARSTGVMDSAGAWEYLLQDTCEEDRNREYRYDRDRERDRERDKASCSSAHSSWMEQQRHREATKRGHKHRSLERNSEGKDDRERRRHGDEQAASSHSSSSRRSRSRKEEKRSHKQKVPKKKRKKKRRQQDDLR